MIRLLRRLRGKCVECGSRSPEQDSLVCRICSYFLVDDIEDIVHAHPWSDINKPPYFDVEDD